VRVEVVVGVEHAPACELCATVEPLRASLRRLRRSCSCAAQQCALQHEWGCGVDTTGQVGEGRRMGDGRVGGRVGGCRASWQPLQQLNTTRPGWSVRLRLGQEASFELLVGKFD